MKKIILDNGLKIFIISDETKHSTFVSLNVLFGGIDDKCYIDNKLYNIKSGLAHFTEHLVLESNCYGDLMYNFGKIGIISNGATDINKTEFYIDAVTNVMDAIKILIKGIHTPRIDKDVINNIRNPIIEEKKRSLDNCYSIIYNKGISNILKNSNYDSILGSIKDLEKINEEDVNFVVDSFYRPCNEIMLIMGNINEDEVVKLIEETYNSLSFKDNNFKKYNYTNDIVIKNKYELIKTNLTVDQSIIVFIFDTDKYKEKDKMILDLCLYYFLNMNFGSMSDYNNNLIQNKIINSPISFSSSIIKGKHYVRISVRTSKHEYFIDSILDLINNYKFDEEIFNLSKRSAIINLVSRKDSIASTIEPLLANIVEYGFEKEDTIEDIEQCTFEIFKNIIKNLKFDNYFVYQIKNKKN